MRSPGRLDELVSGAYRLGTGRRKSDRAYDTRWTMDQFFILTGAFGSGKTTLLEHLRRLGFSGVDEPARPILAEQRRLNGDGLPEREPRRFVELMLFRAVHDYRRMSAATTPVFFDRGIPDMLA